jgi:hypothetical protein
MATKEFERRACDRCGHEVEIQGASTTTRNPPGGWATLLALEVVPNTNVRRLIIGRVTSRGDHDGIDLCPDCAGILKDWWGGRGVS